jgi:hypothetical protein
MHQPLSLGQRAMLEEGQISDSIDRAVRLNSRATTESSHTAELDIPELNAAASKAHVFPGIAL